MKQDETKGAAASVAGDAAETAQAGLEQARQALAKLPILGPALWLYARDAVRRFAFLGDIDWLLMPPVVLDQCRLYSKDGIPFAFFTWARVNEAVDARLRSGTAKLAPHEWNTGPHVWLIDQVAPFGQGDDMVAELLRSSLQGETVNALLPDPQQGGRLAVRTWQAPASAARH